MKKGFMVVTAFFAFVWPMLLHARAGQELKGAYRPAIVVSVTKVETTVDYAYDIGIRLDCTQYVVRYKSANDYLPIGIAPSHPLDVLMGEHGYWMHVVLSPDHIAELRVMSTARAGDESCTNYVTRSPVAIPVGTILPVSLDSMMRSDKSRPGTGIIATLMQDVPLDNGTTLRAGSKVTGHIVEASQPVKGSNEARISFQFDDVRLGSRTVPIAANLRALASSMAISATQVPTSGGDEDFSGNWTLVQIGGAQVSYGHGYPVTVGSEVVGIYASQGVLAYLSQDLGTECRSTIDGNTRPQAFWVFSVHACGAYGFDDVKILHSGRTEPVGEVILTSSGKVVKLARNSAMLLRVDRSGAEETQADAMRAGLESH
jgi:hypothetical protein